MGTTSRAVDVGKWSRLGLTDLPVLRFVSAALNADPSFSIHIHSGSEVFFSKRKEYNNIICVTLWPSDRNTPWMAFSFSSWVGAALFAARAVRIWRGCG